MNKACRSCGVEQPLENYNIARSNRDGKSNLCKSCHKKYMADYADRHKQRLSESGKEYYRKNRENRLRSSRRWAVENPGRVKDKSLRYRFGDSMSLEKYQELLEMQSGVCAICGQDERAARYKSLAVDHDHKTGEVRGLLCSHCNRALGFFQDDADVLRRALEYLESGYIHGPAFDVVR